MKYALLMLSFVTVLTSYSQVAMSKDTKYPSLTPPVTDRKYEDLDKYPVFLDWSWATKTVVDAISFSFHTVRSTKSTSRLSPNFTADGWRQYRLLLHNSGIIPSVEQEKLILNTSIIEVPAVLSEGFTQNNEKYWNIEMPLRLVYQKGSVHSIDELIVNIKVIETPKKSQNSYGTSIAEWTLTRK